MLDDIFNDNKNKNKLLIMFERVVNNDNEYIRFRMCEIE